MKSTKRKMESMFWCLSLSLWSLFALGCSDEKTTTAILDEWIEELPASIEFDVEGGSKEIPFTLGAGVNAEKIACILSEDNREWCNVKLNGNSLSVSVSPSGFSRTSAVTLVYDKDHKVVTYIKQKSDYSKFFTDESCSQLKPGITKAQIEQIPQKQMHDLALALLDGNYDSDFRVADYRPYQSPSVMATKNKTNKYSLRDNPTGIYAEKDDEMFIYLGNMYEGAQISLLIQDLSGGYNSSKTIPLSEGLNRVIAPIKGLTYILNHVEDNTPLLLESETSRKAVTAKTVKVHFISGKVNGYFDILKHSTQAEWLEILNNAKYQDIDVLGKYAHITWTTDAFKASKNNKISTDTEIIKIIENCDKLVYCEQEFMGLVKYNRMFNNRMHFSVDYTTESPNASDYRTVYNDGDYYGEIFYDITKFPSRCWGPAHEVGHCNQTRPGLKWAGTTEVTNNIMSLHIQASFGQPCKLQVDKASPKDEKGNVIPGSPFKNFYEATKAYIIDAERAHCLPGIDINARETQLVPFWQLKLYMIDALGKADFYRDLYEYFRNNPSPSEKGKNGGLDQLDFVRQVCRISGLNMLDFFEKWGFLKPVNSILNDYGNKNFIITQNQVNELKEEINLANYAMPANNVHEITDATWENYK